MLENITDIPPQYSWENVDKSGPVNHHAPLFDFDDDFVFLYFQFLLFTTQSVATTHNWGDCNQNEPWLTMKKAWSLYLSFTWSSQVSVFGHQWSIKLARNGSKIFKNSTKIKFLHENDDSSILREVIMKLAHVQNAILSQNNDKIVLLWVKNFIKLAKTLKTQWKHYLTMTRNHNLG